MPLPARWVTADEAYGKDSKFRLWLQQRRMPYVLAVACNQEIPTNGGSIRADALAVAAPVSAWKRRSSDDGTKGPRLSTGPWPPCPTPAQPITGIAAGC